MAEKEEGQSHKRRPAPATGSDSLTVGLEALLVDGSDARFRAMIHDLLSYMGSIMVTREGLASFIGVTGAQYEILMAVLRLQGVSGITVADLAAWLHRSGSFVTIETGKLETAGLLAKVTDPENRRKVRISLTPQGREAIARLAPVQRQINDMLFADLSKQDFEQLCKLVEALEPAGRRGANLMQYLLSQRDAGVA